MTETRYAACPKCGAAEGQSCTTPSGARAKAEHKDRPRHKERPVAPPVTPPTRDQVNALGALNRVQKHIYAGTVDPVTVLDRRRKNRAARKARRLNRAS